MDTENKNPIPQRGCPKDCRKCSYLQQVFCSAQLSFDSFGVMNSIYMKLDEIEAKLKGLCSDLDALHATGELITPSSPQCAASPFNPNKEEEIIPDE